MTAYECHNNCDTLNCNINYDMYKCQIFETVVRPKCVKLVMFFSSYIVIFMKILMVGMIVFSYKIPIKNSIYNNKKYENKNNNN